MGNKEVMQKATQARLLRGEYVGKLVKKDISFHDFVTLAQLPEYESLSRIVILDILPKMSGWSKNSALYAFTMLDIDKDTTIKQCYKDDYLLATVSDLFEKQATTWQRRISAPDNWPWGDDIISFIIAQYNRDDLPRPLHVIQESARFSLPTDNELNATQATNVEDYVNDDSSNDFEDITISQVTKTRKEKKAREEQDGHDQAEENILTDEEKGKIRDIQDAMEGILSTARDARQEELDELGPAPWEQQNTSTTQENIEPAGGVTLNDLLGSYDDEDTDQDNSNSDDDGSMDGLHLYDSDKDALSKLLGDVSPRRDGSDTGEDDGDDNDSIDITDFF